MFLRLHAHDFGFRGCPADADTGPSCFGRAVTLRLTCGPRSEGVFLSGLPFPGQPPAWHDVHGCGVSHSPLTDLSRTAGSVHARREEANVKRATRRLGLLILGWALLLPAEPVWADETVCRGTIGATTVDNLRVPDGATCKLNGTFVKGTVKVEGDAALRALGIRVIGNVQAENARRVVVRDRSRIGGNLQAFQNTGGVTINNNRIDGNLQCKENVPPPTGGGNVVQGNKEDQCAAL